MGKGEPPANIERKEKCMNTRKLLVSLGKLLLGGIAYFIGLIIGSIVTSVLQLPQPPMPEGVDQASAALALLAVSPILALALALIAPNIGGGWLTRTLILSGLTYVAYTLNTVRDASLYVTAYASTSAFTTVSTLVPSLCCGGAVALLFPPKEKGAKLCRRVESILQPKKSRSMALAAATRQYCLYAYLSFLWTAGQPDHG